MPGAAIASGQRTVGWTLGDRMQTARAIPEIISGLRDRGFGFVTLPES